MSRKILFVHSQPEPPCLKSVMESVSQASKQGQGLEMMEAGSLPEAAMIATGEWRGLVVCSISNKNDLLAALNFLASQTAAIKEKKTVRVVVFNSIPNQKLQSLLLQKGCAEILEFKVPAKTFLYKLKRHIKLVQEKDASDGADDDTTRVIGKSDDAQNASAIGGEAGSKMRPRRNDDDAPASQGPTIQTVPALTVDSDCWLMRSPPDARRLMGRWMVELIGPSPSMGSWVQIQRNGPIKGQGVFEWRINEAGDRFRCPGGRWLFTGRLVEFVWRQNRWRFVGDRVSLAFHEGLDTEKAVAHRFLAESASCLKIAANSEPAKAKQADIEASLASDAHRVQQSNDKSEDTDHARNFDATEETITPEALEQDAIDFQSAKDESAPELACRLESESSENSEDFSYREKERAGTELSGIFDGPPESAELSVTLDKPHAGTELSIDLDKAAEGKELSVTLDKPGEGSVPDYAMNGEDAARELGGDAKRDNVFNSGPGLTQGHKSDSVKYDQEFSTAEDAFKPVGLDTRLNSAPAETLDFHDRQLVLRVLTGQFAAKARARLEILTINLVPPASISGFGTVRSVETEPETGALVVGIELTDSMIEAYGKIQDAMEIRQMNILRFLKLAKGA